MIRRAEIVAAIGMAGLGGVVTWAGVSVPPSFLDTSFGSGFLPMLMGVALLILSGLWLIELFLASRRKERGIVGDAPELLRPTLLGVLFVVFILNMDLGAIPFYPSVALFIFLAACLIGDRSRRTAVVAAIVAIPGTLLIWFLFTHAFLVIIR